MLLTACDSILGINVFPAVPEDAGQDATMPPVEAGIMHPDGGRRSGRRDDALGGRRRGRRARRWSRSTVDVVDAEANDGSDGSDGSDASDASDASDPVVSIAVGGTEACAVTASGAPLLLGTGARRRRDE